MHFALSLKNTDTVATSVYYDVCTTELVGRVQVKSHESHFLIKSQCEIAVQ